MRNDVSISDRDVRYDIALIKERRGMGYRDWIKQKRLSYHVEFEDEKHHLKVRLKRKGRVLLKKINKCLSPTPITS